MIIAIVLCLLSFSSVRSDGSVGMNMIKEMPAEKMPMMDTAIAKEKRFLNHHHHDGLPCPPVYPNLIGHSSPLTLTKPITKIVTSSYHHMPTYVHQPSWHQPMHHQLWQPVPQHQLWQPMHQGWQPKVIVQKPVFPYAPMYHHQPSVQPHYSQNLIKYHQPQVYHKPLVLLNPCTPMPCKPMMPSYHYPKSEIKYVEPEPQVSYVKVPQPIVHQPLVHHPMPVYLPPPLHLHKISHGVKEICAK